MQDRDNERGILEVEGHCHPAREQRDRGRGGDCLAGGKERVWVVATWNTSGLKPCVRPVCPPSLGRASSHIVSG